MSYITREDGQHFVIPSYRDVLIVKQQTQLKKDILQLSKSYGEYITLQKKGTQHYEVAFSSETGYLLGESIWHYFKRPMDLIYCESIPNTTEAILVIVKAGSVYLDGSFPLESIPEELLTFLTQQNNFEIYVYGDVPISKESESGKFSFEPGAVKSFNVLEEPIFPKLPLLKVYQLKLVNTVLKEQGIGAFPVAKLIAILAIAGAAWGIYEMFFTEPPPPPPEEIPNPYQAFYDLMSSPAPDDEITKLAAAIPVILQIPGWSVTDILYANSGLTAKVVSQGASIADLNAWAAAHKATVSIQQAGITVSLVLDTPLRPIAKNIYSSQQVLAEIIDRLATVTPGNVLNLGASDRSGSYTSVEMTVNLNDISSTVLDLIGKQFSGLPVVLTGITATVSDSGYLNGRINFKILGS